MQNYLLNLSAIPRLTSIYNIIKNVGKNFIYEYNKLE